MFLLLPSPFLPSAPVFSLRSVCVCRSGLWMTNVFVQDHPKISCSREECFSLSVGLFYFALFGLRTLLCRSRLRRPYYSRSACVLQRLTRRVFLTFRRLISLCFVWVALPPSPFLPSVPVLFSVSLCVSQQFMDDLCFRVRSSENLLLTRRVFLVFRRLILLYSKLRTLLHRSRLRCPYYSRSPCVCRSGL